MVIQSMPQNENLFLRGNLNEHIGMTADVYTATHRGFGYRERNFGAFSILDFAIACELVIVNILFKKNDDHLVAFKCGTTKTQIDYFLTKAENRRLCKDCKVMTS